MVNTNLFELILHIVTIFVFIFLLKKYFYNPMRKYIENRAQKIELDYNNAEILNIESEVALSFALEEMERVKVESKTLIENILISSQIEKQIIIEQTESKINDILQSGIQNLSNEINIAKKELKAEIADITVDIANELVKKR
ncbi:MAG: ATP synthase F0 subunit B [Candidatus Riflemargulisbacteria bacterium]